MSRGSHRVCGWRRNQRPGRTEESQAIAAAAATIEEYKLAVIRDAFPDSMLLNRKERAILDGGLGAGDEYDEIGGGGVTLGGGSRVFRTGGIRDGIADVSTQDRSNLRGPYRSKAEADSNISRMSFISASGGGGIFHQIADLDGRVDKRKLLAYMSKAVTGDSKGRSRYSPTREWYARSTPAACSAPIARPHRARAVVHLGGVACGRPLAVRGGRRLVSTRAQK